MMGPYSRRGASLPALIYFVVLVPGPWTLLLIILGLLASFPAFIYLVLNMGRRISWATLLLFIPVVGALYSLFKLSRRSGPLVVLSMVTWSYPFLILFATGVPRILFAGTGAGLLWAFLNYHKAYRNQPALSAIFVLSFPTLILVLIVSLVFPFLASSTDLDVDLDHDHDQDFHFAPMSEASLHNENFYEQSFTDTGSSLFQAHQSSEFPHPETEVPPTAPHQDLLPGAEGANFKDLDHQNFPSSSTSSGPSLVFSHASEIQDLGESSDLVYFPEKIDEISFDQISGDPTIKSGSEQLTLHHSEVSDRLIGRLQDGASVEVWRSPVTGEIIVNYSGEISKFHLDPIEHSWKSVGPEGTIRIAQDPISGGLKLNTPSFDTTFRFNPFENKLVAE